MYMFSWSWWLLMLLLLKLVLHQTCNFFSGSSLVSCFSALWADKSLSHDLVVMVRFSFLHLENLDFWCWGFIFNFFPVQSIWPCNQVHTGRMSSFLFYLHILFFLRRRAMYVVLTIPAWNSWMSCFGTRKYLSKFPSCQVVLILKQSKSEFVYFFFFEGRNDIVLCFFCAWAVSDGCLKSLQMKVPTFGEDGVLWFGSLIVSFLLLSKE